MPHLPVGPRPLVLFACLSLVAVGLGAAVCAMSGVAVSLWVRNLGAWAVGALFACGLARWAGRRTLYVAAIVALLGLVASLLDPGIEGVHRWFVVGPIRMNAAMLLLPSLVVATAVLITRTSWGWLPAIVALVVLAMQPDASQATALALAVCALAAPRIANSWPARAAAAAAALIAGFSWTRADPLQPVPEVEEIIQLAARQSPLLAVLGILLLAASAASPWLATRDREAGADRTAGVALSALLAGWALGPALGAFPTPLIGVGLSPILGAWIGVGFLASLRR